MKHIWYEKGDGHSCREVGECSLCSLSVCKVCCLVEGSLTTDCPGENVYHALADKVYNEKLDYRDAEGGWVNKFSPHMQFRLQTAISDFIRGVSPKSELEIRISFGASAEEYAKARNEVVKQFYG